MLIADCLLQCGDRLHLGCVKSIRTQKPALYKSFRNKVLSLPNLGRKIAFHKCAVKRLTVARLHMKLGLDTSRPAYVPLRDAMLCIDCEFVSPAANGKCSICGGTRLVILSELLELLVVQAFGAKAPARLADLAGILVSNNSAQRPGDTKQEEPSRYEPLRYFEA
jgi:hypothetical protein